MGLKAGSSVPDGGCSFTAIDCNNNNNNNNDGKDQWYRSIHSSAVNFHLVMFRVTRGWGAGHRMYFCMSIITRNLEDIQNKQTPPKKAPSCI